MNDLLSTFKVKTGEREATSKENWSLKEDLFWVEGNASTLEECDSFTFGQKYVKGSITLSESELKTFLSFAKSLNEKKSCKKKKVKEEEEPITVTITKDSNGEFRVPAPDKREASAYYTDDKEDAIGTAENFMYKGQNITIKFRSVVDHPEGK